MTLTEALDQAFAALAKGDEREAARCGQIALKLDPNNAAVQTVWGRLALMAPRLQLALSIFNKLTQGPCPAETWLDLARVLVALRREEDAALAVANATMLEPQNAGAWAFSGDVLLSLNRREEAAHAFRRALALDPLYMRANHTLTRAAKIAPGSPEAARMLKLTEASGVTNRQLSDLHYALSYIHKSAGDDDGFIAHLLAAGAARKREKEGSRDVYSQMYDRLDEAFTASNFANARAADPKAPTPIFVVGMPRSGSTLVEQIISGHRDVMAGGELRFSRHTFTPAFERTTGQLFPLGFETLSNAQWNELAEPWTQLFNNIGRGARYVTDKSPGNYHLLGLLPLLFPACKIVHTRRDPMDTCFSILQQPFEDQAPHTSDMELLAHTYAHYQRLMQRWEKLCPEKFMTQDYENLVREPEAESQQLMAYCGLDWSPDLLSFHERNAAVHTFSTQQVRAPVHTSSVGAWRRYAKALEPLRTALIAEGVAVD